MSNNNLAGTLPYQFPQNLQHLYVSISTHCYFGVFFGSDIEILMFLLHSCRNLANNNFNGGIPYSFSDLTSLITLCVIILTSSTSRCINLLQVISIHF